MYMHEDTKGEQKVEENIVLTQIRWLVNLDSFYSLEIFLDHIIIIHSTQK